MDEAKEAKVVLTLEREANIMNAMYDYVMRVTEHSRGASPAEVEALPKMIKLLIDYWAIQY